MRREKTINRPESEFTGRIMPQARELEEAVIGAVLIENRAIETAAAILSPEMFYDKSNETIFSAFLELEKNREPIDMLTVIEQLRKTGNLEACGGASHLAEILRPVVSSAHLEYHCRIVKDKYLCRKFIEICSSNTGLGFEESEDIEDLVAKLSSETEQLQEIMVGKNDTRHISEAVRKSIEQMHARIEQRSRGITPGITSGFADLDRLLNGWQKEKLVILAARPGVGKTSLAIHFAKRAAKRGFSVACFSLEMGASEFTDKMIISESGVNADDYNSGEIQPGNTREAERAGENIRKLPIYIDDYPKQTVINIANKARLLKKQGRCDMVIIDYLQLITPVTKNVIREQEVSETTRLLKVYAKELKVPFIVLCQMNRESEKDGGSKPKLSSLRESGAIEQDADIVMFIVRPGMHDGKVRDENTGELVDNCIELLIKKHRGGKLGKVKVKHNDSMSDFYDWDIRGYSAAAPDDSNYRNFYGKEEMPF